MKTCFHLFPDISHKFKCFTCFTYWSDTVIFTDFYCAKYLLLCPKPYQTEHVPFIEGV